MNPARALRFSGSAANSGIIRDPARAFLGAVGATNCRVKAPVLSALRRTDRGAGGACFEVSGEGDDVRPDATDQNTYQPSHDAVRAVIVNGEEKTLAAPTLAAALVELGYGTARVATAVNGAFVPVAQRPDVALATGDKIEIVAAREGG
jgi:sulfur carrier protein